VKCIHCHKNIDYDSLFCCYCGRKVNQNITIKSTTTNSKKTDSQVRYSIGRSSDNDIILNYPQISGKHAWLINDNKTWVIEDRGSTNKTYVNDRNFPIKRKLIQHCDQIFFGSFKISPQKLINMIPGTKEKNPPKEITLPQKKSIIGRDPQAHIPINQPQISWHHAEIDYLNGAFCIKDLDSTNGTFVNSKRIKQSEINYGDLISLGSFTFQISKQHIVVKKDQDGVRLDAKEISVNVIEKKTRQTKKIVNNISFTIYPSELVGLMGPSGAGKTTLMLALNGYKKPSQGQVFANNISLIGHYDCFRQRIGYVPQDDIIHHELTVKEALFYTAKLRLAKDLTEKEINNIIDNVLTELGLIDDKKQIDVRDVIIGSKEDKGISGGQRKRVNLAMELVNDPDLLFLDEPTSGLSTQDSIVVVDILKKLSNKGKTIIMTIHQPDIEIFKMMDNIMMISSGKMMYYGPSFPDALTFFNPDSNESDILSDAGSLFKGFEKKDEQTWNDLYVNSAYCKSYIKDRKNSTHSPSQEAKAPFDPTFDINQWWTLTCRFFLIKKKDTLNTIILFSQAPIIAILICLVYNDNEMKIIYSLFLLVISALWFGVSNSAREIVAEKAIFLRERMVNLKILPYYFSKFSIIGVLSILQCIILVTTIYWFLGFQGNIYLYFIYSCLGSFSGISIGLFISTVSKTQQAALAIVPIILIPMVILGGALVTVKNMNQSTRLLSYFVPSRWVYEMLIKVEDHTLKKVKNLDSSENSNIFITYNDRLFGTYGFDICTIIPVVLIFIGIFVSLTIFILYHRRP